MSSSNEQKEKPVVGDGPNLKSGVWDIKKDLAELAEGRKELLESGGVKHDTGKQRWDLLPYGTLAEIVRVFTFGANKYDDRNWEKGFNYSRVFGALQRHLVAWFEGEDCDPETGINHLAHAGCNIFFLLTFVLRGVGTDDRPKKV